MSGIRSEDYSNSTVVPDQGVKAAEDKGVQTKSWITMTVQEILPPWKNCLTSGNA